MADTYNDNNNGTPGENFYSKLRSSFSNNDVSMDDSEMNFMVDASEEMIEEEVEGEVEEEEEEEQEEVPIFPFLCASSSDIQLPHTGTKKKLDMLHRRPVFLPKSRALLAKYERQMSYFSEKMAEDQFAAQHITDCIYNYKYGIYERCEGQTLERMYYPESCESINGLAFSSCGKYFAIGFGCGDFKVWSKEDKVISTSILYGERSKILCVRNLPNYGEPIFVGSTISGVILVCMCHHYSKWFTWEYIREPPNEINSFDVNMTGSKLVTGGKDATLRLYDFQTAKLLNTFKRRDMDCDKLIHLYLNNMEDRDDGHYRRIYAIKFRDDEIFLSGGNDNTVKIWDVRASANPVQNIYGPHICGDTLDVLDSKILTGQWTHSDSIEIWDLRTSRKLRTMNPRNRRQIFVNEFPYCCRFMRYENPNGLPQAHGDLIAVGGSGLGALEVQSIDYNSIAHKFLEPGQITSIAQHEDLIVYGTTNNVLGFCNFYPPKAKQVFQSLKERAGEEDIGEEQHISEYEEEQIFEEDNQTQVQKFGFTESGDVSASSESKSSPSVSESSSSSTSKSSYSSNGASGSSILNGKSSSFGESKESMKQAGIEETTPLEGSLSDLLEEESSSSEDRPGKRGNIKSNLKMLKKQADAYLRERLTSEQLNESSVTSFGSSDSTDEDTLLEFVSSDNSIFDFPSDTEIQKSYRKK